MNDRTEAPVAERLYYDSPELVFTAQVTDIQLMAREQGADGEKTQLWRVALDRTAFYPESGGQPPDMGVLVATARSGAVLEVPVERVEEDESGEVWHFVRKPLVEGTQVEGRVDEARRLDHMQQHSGQHLLSAVFLDRLQGRTVSFHLGADSSTIDLVLPEGRSSLERSDLAAVEDEVNRLIYADRSLRSSWHTREEAEAMLARGELRKLPERVGPMRVVSMEGIEFNACGGTHVSSTGAIGGLVLRRMERVKQGWRVEFLCGLRAVRATRREYEVLSSAANALSAGISDVPARVGALQESVKSAAKLQRALLEELAVATAASLVGSATASPIVRLFADKPVEFAKRVASAVATSGRSAVVGVTEEGKGALALALAPGDARHAGNLLREIAVQRGARGGGGADLAQAVCNASELQGFADAVGQSVKPAAV